MAPFFRNGIKGLILRAPALAERREDVALLAARFLADLSKRRLRLAPDALAWLAEQEWTGNVRELRVVVTTGAALAEGDAVTAADLAFVRTGDPAALAPAMRSTLAEAVVALERRMITTALAATGNNHSAAARRLGLSRVGLLKMMTRLGLRRSGP